MKNTLLWIAVLPGAILSAFLISFPLHFVLYQTLSNFVEPYPQTPERILFPLVAAITFQFVGVKIAPCYKNRTALILFVLWLSFCIYVACVLLFLDRNFISNFAGHGGGLGPLFAFVGAFTGLYINWKTQWEKPINQENNSQ